MDPRELARMRALQSIANQEALPAPQDWTPEKEDEFRPWYEQQATQQGLDLNPNAREHFYDYRSAFNAGVQPDESGHWPSEFKTEEHPRYILDGMNTKTGRFQFLK